MASQASYLDFRPFGLDRPKFHLADEIVDPAKTESRRPHVKAYLKYLIPHRTEKFMNSLWKKAPKIACEDYHGQGRDYVSEAELDYLMDKRVWRVWFSVHKKAGCEVPGWPWEDMCVAGVASEASPLYARYLEEIGAGQPEGPAEEEHMGIHGAAFAAETEMVSSQMEEPSVESSRALPIQFSCSKEVEAAVLGMVQGDNVAEDLSAWIIGGGPGEAVSRANMAELVWLRHCDPDMRQTVVNWAATAREYAG